MKIKRPTLVINKVRVLKNIGKMVKKAELSGVHFRPHFKTHQSAEIASYFVNYGITKITVSSFDMAEYFMNNGWQDITVAFPVNILEIDKINRLAKRLERLNLLIESDKVAIFLKESLISEVNIWIKIDVGYNRTGISYDSIDRIIKLITVIEKSEMMKFTGFLAHFGDTYHASSIQEIENIFQRSVAKLNNLREKLRGEGINQVQLSIGDTPSCSVIKKFERIDEIRPGNFVFYDLMQFKLGSCHEEEIAAVVACPVVAKHEKRLQLVVYGGAVHFSKERIVEKDGTVIYGILVQSDGTKWGKMINDCYISSLSQEHGIVTVTQSVFEETEIGDVLLFFPVHSCLTANLLRNSTLITNNLRR